MDFSDLMSIASNNQVNAVNKVKNRKSKDGSSSQVSSAAVKAFLARQNAEKAKQKEQEEAARRARIQARLQEKQLDKSKNNKKPADSPNDSVDQKQKYSIKNRNIPPAQDLTTSTSKNQSKHNLTQRKRTDDDRTIVKSKEKEKVMKRLEERPKPIEQKKPVTKVKKPAQPVMSFQELMNVAKKQADNPDAFQNITPAHGPKIGKNIEENSPAHNRSMEDKRKKEIPEENNRVTGKTNREKSTISQNKQNVKTQEGKLSDTAKRKKPESRDRKQLEIQNRKLPSKCDGNNDRKFPGKAEIDAKRKSLEKPKIMTIERQTISQRECESPMKYRESKEHFQRKRRHNPYDEDEYDDDMDKFIDDSEEAPETVSSYIKEIFGYDKNRFRDRDEDINNMESSYGDIQKEEAKSLRIAKLEDEVEKLKESYELEQQQTKKKKLKH